MRKIKEVLRLSWGMGLGNRQIARSLQVSPGTISDMLRRAREAGLSWPLPEDMDDCALENRLYSNKLPEAPAGLRPQPDMEWIHRGLHRKGVRLQLLWWSRPGLVDTTKPRDRLLRLLMRSLC